jgi:hypothetical protein
MNMNENMIAIALILAMCVAITTCSYSALRPQYQDVHHERD